MARRPRLTATQIAELFDPPLEQHELVRHFTLSATDLVEIQRCRGDHNRLGYPRQNGVAAALRELGRLERTLFTLNWIDDPELRRTTGQELNKGESRNSLARAVFIHRLGEIRDRTYENGGSVATEPKVRFRLETRPSDAERRQQMRASGLRHHQLRHDPRF